MRIIIADDANIARHDLGSIITRGPPIEIVGEADDRESLLCLVDTTPADVILLDMGLPRLGGFDVLEKIHAKHPEANVIILTKHGDAASIRTAIELGVSGYLLRSVGREELLRALRRVKDGHRYVQGELTGALLEAMADRPPPVDKLKES